MVHYLPSAEKQLEREARIKNVYGETGIYSYLLNRADGTADKLPSYLMFMFFKMLYGFSPITQEFGLLGKENVFYSIRQIKDITEKMGDAYKHYLTTSDSLETTPGKGFAANMLVGVQAGGEVRKFVTPYLQNSMNLDTKNTYYIVVDLDLYPGRDISSADKFRLNCTNRYDKIKSAWADILAVNYEPVE